MRENPFLFYEELVVACVKKQNAKFVNFDNRLEVRTVNRIFYLKIFIFFVGLNMDNLHEELVEFQILPNNVKEFRIVIMLIKYYNL